MTWLERRFRFVVDLLTAYRRPYAPTAWSTHGSTRTAQRTPPRSVRPASTVGLGGAGSTPASVAGSVPTVEPWSQTTPAYSAELPLSGSPESALDWAETLLNLATVLDEEGFSHAAGRLVMASAQLREWADEEGP